MIGPEGYERFYAMRAKALEEKQLLPATDEIPDWRAELYDQCRRDDDTRLSADEIEDRSEREYLRWLTR